MDEKKDQPAEQQPPQPQAPQTPPVQPAQPQPKGKRNMFLIGGLLVVLLIVGYVAATYFFKPGLTGAIIGTGPGVKVGDTIKVLYTGTLQDGSIFDTNRQDVAEKARIERPSFEPLAVVVGSGSVIPGFDEALVGMKKGELK